MKHLIISLGILVLSGIFPNIVSYAQSANKDESMLSRDTTAKVSGDSTSIALALPDTNVVLSLAAVDSLKTLIKSNQAIIASKTSKIDSLYGIISSKDAEIKQLTEERAFVDTCMARLANRWLYEKFNEQDVNEAIGYFNKILSTQLRRDRSVILELLKSYKSAYMEFQSIILDAQRDPDRDNPFSAVDYKNRYKSRIESMPYYVRYYHQSWNIRYLNERIKDALARIEAHSATKPADFSDLIDDNE